MSSAINHFWPSFIPVRGSPQNHPVKAKWLEACTASPMFFFVLIVGASQSYLSQCNGSDSRPDNHVWRARFHSLAIKHVNEYISRLDLADEPSDEILACLLTLAWFSAESVVAPSKVESALTTAQNLDGVSRRAYVQAHKDALYYLVRRKGDLSKISLYGISHLIQT